MKISDSISKEKEQDREGKQREAARTIQQAKVVLFDHNDTLVGTMKAKWAQHKYIASKFYGKKLSDEELRVHWGKPLTAMIKLLYETDHINIAMSYNIATRKRFPKVLFKDTLPTLKALREAGKKIGIVTASPLSSILCDFDTLGLSRQLIDYLQTEDDTVVHKPDFRAFDPAIKWLSEQNIPLSEAVYVGDSLDDLKSATEAGFRFIGVATGIVSMNEFVERGVFVVSELSELCTSDMQATRLSLCWPFPKLSRSTKHHSGKGI